jgi:SAM-dependent methyltransferase
MTVEMQSLTELEKIRDQFDHAPYPRIPLEESPTEKHELLYCHNLVTPSYLKYRSIVETEGKLILDAGCGSGYKSLVLAEANPGARIVGVDLSENSVNLARERLKYHKREDTTEFHALSILDLPQLGMKFDYINCDEVLYLFDDPAEALSVMKSVLNPGGIIRTNLHNAYQRAVFFRAQELFKFIGLMDESPKDDEYQAVTDTMKALRDSVNLKASVWNSNYENPALSTALISMNLLFVGDKGYTILDLFNFLEQADLEFISMVNWRQWDILDLFRDPEELPMFLDMGLSASSIGDRLHLYELLNPVHRLMDFWCTNSDQTGSPVEDWSDAEWRSAMIQLHPQLQNDHTKDVLLECIARKQGFEISESVRLPALSPVILESTMAAALLPLWDEPQSMNQLTSRYQKLKPVDPITLESISEEFAFQEMKDLLNRLDAFLYVLINRPS